MLGASEPDSFSHRNRTRAVERRPLRPHVRVPRLDRARLRGRSGRRGWCARVGHRVDRVLVAALGFGLAARREWRLLAARTPPTDAARTSRPGSRTAGPGIRVRRAPRRRALVDASRARRNVHVPDGAARGGEVLEPIRISGDALGPLFTGAARRALGASSAASRITEVIWSDGGDELAVDPGKVEVRTTTGAIGVAIPVRCDETGPRPCRSRSRSAPPTDRPACTPRPRTAHAGPHRSSTAGPTPSSRSPGARCWSWPAAWPERWPATRTATR